MFDVKDFVLLICEVHYSGKRAASASVRTRTTFSQSFAKLESPHPACSLREQADLPAWRGGEIPPSVAGGELAPAPPPRQARRGSGRPRPPSSRYPAGTCRSRR